MESKHCYSPGYGEEFGVKQPHHTALWRLSAAPFYPSRVGSNRPRRWPWPSRPPALPSATRPAYTAAHSIPSRSVRRPYPPYWSLEFSPRHWPVVRVYSIWQIVWTGRRGYWWLAPDQVVFPLEKQVEFCHYLEQRRIKTEILINF